MDLTAAPNFLQLRNVAAPVGADGADPGLLTGVRSRDFESVSVYWDDIAAADGDTLTCRVLFLDEPVDDTLAPIWLRSIPQVLPRGVRRQFPCLGSRVQVRIDAFSNPAVPCTIRAAGVGVKRRSPR